MSGYELAFPAPDAWINANHRLHWAKRAKLTRSWRAAANIQARRAGLPKRLSRVHVVADIHKPTGRKYDVGNLHPTLKACIDGLVDYGLIVDDDNAHLVGPDLRAGTVGPAGVTITITEIVG